METFTSINNMVLFSITTSYDLADLKPIYGENSMARLIFAIRTLAMRTVFIGGVIAVLSAPATAADSGGKYAIDGAGRASCADFLTARKKNGDNLRVFAGWVDGYITAFNHFNQDTYDLTGWQSVELLLAKLAKYCEVAPTQLFNIALVSLAQVLYEDRLTKESQVVRLRAGSQAIYLYQSMLPRLHAALAAAGFDAGSEPDKYTDAMADAIRKYQASISIPVSGLPDQLTLNSLFP